MNVDNFTTYLSDDDADNVVVPFKVAKKDKSGKVRISRTKVAVATSCYGLDDLAAALDAHKKVNGERIAVRTPTDIADAFSETPRTLPRSETFPVDKVKAALIAQYTPAQGAVAQEAKEKRKQGRKRGKARPVNADEMNAATREEVNGHLAGVS